MAKKQNEEIDFNDKNIVWVTEEGLKQLQDRYDYLKNVKRQEVAQKIAVARSYGDLSENSEYSAAKDEQSATEAELLALDEKIKKARIIPNDDTKSKKDRIVRMGSTVKVFDRTFDEELTYKIVGSTESDPLNNLLSNESPAGKALIGKKIGDIAEYDSINSGKIEMEILDITN